MFTFKDWEEFGGMASCHTFCICFLAYLMRKTYIYLGIPLEYLVASKGIQWVQFEFFTSGLEIFALDVTEFLILLEPIN